MRQKIAPVSIKFIEYCLHWLTIKLSTKSRLDSLVLTTALLFTVAVLVYLSLIFIGCSLSSSPKGLHFLKVDLKEFLKLRDLQIRDLSNINTAHIESGGRNTVKGVVSSIYTSANEAIYKATSAASSMVEAQSVVYLYITGFVVTILSGVLAYRKVFFSKGSRSLAIFYTLSSILITTATIAVTVIYGIFASKVKNTLQPYGVKVILRAKMITTV
ncbi:unnamed protein product [Penicillium roqueforti FM164]|uniref:Genomic scaffold, ProqFM164S02 n=1 Tax=Penicillium roqueforti (strain FM164) TaxID=1365484 RepID=W6Q9P5_PENRF|nr:unnamed protein product [Penicillium roqueforti FM164]